MTDALDYEPKRNPETGRELLPNPQRGCGYLEEEKGYIRTDPVRAEDGIPSFVTFDPPVPYKEGTLRSFERFDGIGFQLSIQGTFSTVPEGDVDDLLDRLRGSEDGTHWGAIPTAYAQDILMWAGATYYDDPRGFIDEARKYGLNKAIPVSKRQAPPEINPFKTRCFVVHPAAYRVYEQTTEREDRQSFTVDEGTALDEARRMVEDTLHGSDFTEYEILERHEDADGDVEYVEVRFFDHEDGPKTEKVRVSYLDDNDLGADDAETPERTIPGVVGYSYLTRIVWTAPSDGDVPKWVQEYQDTGQVDVVDVGEPVPEDEVEQALSDVAGDLADVQAAAQQVLARPANTQTPGHGGDVGGGGDDDSQADPGTTGGDEPDSDESDGADGMSESDLPDDYNDLKRLAADVGADVSAQPTKDELHEAILAASGGG